MPVTPLIFRVTVRGDMPNSVCDVHFPSDPRRNRWKRKPPEFLTHREALAASVSSTPLLCLSPATPGCHIGVGVDQRCLWCDTEL